MRDAHGRLCWVSSIYVTACLHCNCCVQVDKGEANDMRECAANGYIVVCVTENTSASDLSSCCGTRAAALGSIDNIRIGWHNTRMRKRLYIWREWVISPIRVSEIISSLAYTHGALRTGVLPFCLRTYIENV